MSKNRIMTTRTLAYCALLSALSVVLARLLGFHITETTRISLEAVPIMISGILFGPLAGGLVGFVSDFVGCMFSPYGYNPVFCVPPIMYGLCSGLARNFLAKKFTIPRLLLVEVPVAAVASVFWQGLVLTYVYASEGAFWQNYLVRLGERTVQFSATIVIDVLLVYMLFRAKIFHRLNIWPPKKTEIKKDKL